MDFTIPDDLRELQKATEKFVREELLPREMEIEEKGDVPEDIIRKIGALGYFGATMPEDYGGMGIGALGFALIMEEFAKTNSAIRSIVALNNGLAVKGIVLDGTKEQKQKYLPKLATGEYIASFCLTEPHCGSDAAAMKTTAVRKDGGWVINGRKHFITNAPIAHVYTVYAVTDKERRGRGGISAFIVERGTPGLSIGKIQETMGARGGHVSEVIFEDCFVSDSQVIGEPGQGFITAMKSLDDGRVTIAASCVGIAQRCLDLASEYAKERQAFGKPIAANQAIQWMLADTATEIHASRLMAYHAAWKIDRGEKIPREAAMAKLFASEAADRAADRAVQVFGGMGWMREMPIERIYRDVRMMRIVEGTSEIQRMIIARDILKD